MIQRKWGLITIVSNINNNNNEKFIYITEYFDIILYYVAINKCIQYITYATEKMKLFKVA